MRTSMCSFWCSRWRVSPAPALYALPVLLTRWSYSCTEVTGCFWKRMLGEHVLFECWCCCWCCCCCCCCCCCMPSACCVTRVAPQVCMAPTPTLLPDLMFHDLVFGHELGSGSFSVVKYAKHIVHGKPASVWPEYAVKVISTELIRRLGTQRLSVTVQFHTRMCFCCLSPCSPRFYCFCDTSVRSKACGKPGLVRMHTL